MDFSQVYLEKGEKEKTEIDRQRKRKRGGEGRGGERRMI